MAEVTPAAEIRLPRLNANDDRYLLAEWLVEDGQPVSAGEPVAVVETSKAAEELVTETAGVLSHAVPAGAEYPPDTVIARVSATAPAEAPRRPAEPESVPGDSGDGGPVVTAPARALLNELGIPPERLAERFPELATVRVIRRTDVARLAAPGAPAVPGEAGEVGETAAPGVASGNVQALPRVQQAVAATVELSHRTIPAAYLAVRVDAGAAEALGRRLTRQLRALVGLPELLVAAVARLHERFPLCFATPLDGRSVRLADAPHVGVTMDMGEGLFVPVVRDPARRGLREIATDLMRYRLAATRGDFRPQDLVGANIMVALNNAGDAVTAVPIVFPGQTCAVSLAATHSEPVATESGEITVRPMTSLGLAYDHRFLNGRDAAQFLHALKVTLESPEQLADPEAADPER